MWNLFFSYSCYWGCFVIYILILIYDIIVITVWWCFWPIKRGFRWTLTVIVLLQHVDVICLNFVWTDLVPVVKVSHNSNGDAENARPENDGQRKLWVWKMQDWKMTDKILANSGQNYGVWEMQEYKSSWVQPTHTVYIKEAVRDTLQSSTSMSCPLCCTPIDMVMRVYFWMCIWRTTVRHFSN